MAAKVTSRDFPLFPLRHPDPRAAGIPFGAGIPVLAWVGENSRRALQEELPEALIGVFSVGYLGISTMLLMEHFWDGESMDLSW